MLKVRNKEFSMAKSNMNKRVVGVKASSVALFEGTFFGAIGLGVAIIHSLRATVDIADATQSVLSGMAFGLATGVVSILVLPFLYFGLGWLIGYLHGVVFNLIAESSGGISLRLEDDK